jgi:hypothetical protein
MIRNHRLLVAVAAIAVSFGALGAKAQAQGTLETATCSTAAECACLAALQAGTPEALEAYIEAYPPGPGAENACTVSAFEEEIHNDTGPTGSPS